MKFIFFLLVIAFTIQGYPDKDSVINLLLDEWEWVSTNGGWGGMIDISPQTEGYTKSLKITKDSLGSLFYVIYKNGTSIDSGVVGLSLSYSIYSADSAWGITISGIGADGISLMPFYIIQRLGSVRLDFGDNVYDGFAHWYNRIATNTTPKITLLHIKNTYHITTNLFNNMTTITQQNQKRPFSIYIVDVLGKMIEKFPDINGNTVIWRHDNYSAGVYFIRIMDNGKNYTKQFILR